MKFFVLLFVILACNVKSTELLVNNSSTYNGSGNITKGIAQTTIHNLLQCDQPGSRISAVGIIKDQEHKSWVVPGTNHYDQSVMAYDLYNECNAVTPNSMAEVDINSVPITKVDEYGEVVTAYIFADNYFELYINSQLIAVDPVPFTPFNSNIVRFQVKKPYSITVKVIDWEENLGVGSESFYGAPYHAGDGGFIASFSDGTVTNGAWKAQTFYTAPIKDLRCLTEEGSYRRSSTCNHEDAMDGRNFYGVHWKIPEDVFDIEFDYGKWPNATTYTEAQIGVDNKKSYMNFIEKFSGSGAQFIWSTNVILDNEVILQYTVN